MARAPRVASRRSPGRRRPDGDEAVWGTVLSWVPERHVRLTWHPGSDPAKASEVEVRFDPVGDSQTLVTIEHRGWSGSPIRPRHGPSTTTVGRGCCERTPLVRRKVSPPMRARSGWC